MEQHDVKTSREVFSDVGGVIAAERKRQGITLADISKRLCILESNLVDIEAGNLDNLPAMAYVIGFIRSYARLLNLDHDKICADIKTSLGAAEDKPEIDSAESGLTNKKSIGLKAVAIGALGIVIFGGLYSFSRTPSQENTAENITQVPAEEILIIEDEIISVEPEEVAIIPGADDVDEKNTAPPITVLEEADEQKSVSVKPETSKVTEAYAVGRSPDTEIFIEATAKSWVEVSRADGTSIISRLMNLGDTYLVPGDEDLYLTTGNAGGLNVRLGDDDPFTLGTLGEALRELPLNKAFISERY